MLAAVNPFSLVSNDNGEVDEEGGGGAEEWKVGQGRVRRFTRGVRVVITMVLLVVTVSTSLSLNIVKRENRRTINSYLSLSLPIFVFNSGR